MGARLRLGTGASLRCATARVFEKLDAARRNPGAASPLENENVYADNLDPYLLTHVVDPNLNMTIYDHDEVGNLTSVTDKLGNKTTFVYFDNPMNPKHRNLIAEIHRPTVTVDDPGVAGYQRTYETTYDPTYFEYDSNGNLVTITDAKGNDTVFTVGADGQVTSITDRNNNTTTFTYYSSSGASHDGNLKEIITPSGPNSAPSRTYTFHYDFFDNVIKVTDPLSNEWEYEFDDDNRPTKITDALNNYVDMTYEDNRLSEISAPANSSSVYRRRTKYEYSDIGRLTGIRTRMTHDRTLSCGAVPPNCRVAATAAVLKYDP